MATGPRNEALRALAAEFGFTEEALAEEVNQRAHVLFGKYGNTTARVVRCWLSGQVRWPTPYHLLPLENIFGVPALRLGFVPRGKCSLAKLADIRRRVDKAAARGAGPGDRATGQEASVLRREFFIAAGALLDIGVTPLSSTGRVTMADVATVRDAQLLYSRVALGHAAQGEPARASRAIALAETALDKASGDAPPWLAFCGPAEIFAQASMSSHRLGHLADAERLRQQSLALWPAAFQRNRFGGTVGLASIQLDAGYLDEAVASATGALDLLPAVRSVLYTGKLADVRKRLEPYRAVGQVADFIERFDASDAPSRPLGHTGD